MIYSNGYYKYLFIHQDLNRAYPAMSTQDTN